jgi:hypothetical protein
VNAVSTTGRSAEFTIPRLWWSPLGAPLRQLAKGDSHEYDTLFSPDPTTALVLVCGGCVQRSQRGLLDERPLQKPM